jgi:hypothetical protein
MIASASRGPDNGIYLTGGSNLPARPNLISNNVIKDFRDYGVHIYYLNGCIVSANDISRPTRTYSATTVFGIYCAAAASKTIIVDGNKIHNLRSASLTSQYPCYGISFNGGPTAGFEHIIRNNVIYNMDGNHTQHGIRLDNARYTWVYHNTISLENSASTIFPTYGVYVSGVQTPGPDIKNNIISIGRAGSGDKYALYFYGAAAGSSDYNDLYVHAEEGRKYTGGYNGIDYPTLADWKTANSGAYDQNSKDGPPLFENEGNGNLKPQAAVVDNTGTSLSAVPKDILGNDRTGPDIGAWEFVLPSMPAMAVSNVAATQNALSPVMIGSNGEMILRIEITTTGSSSPLNVTQFDLGVAGSTASGNYTGARIYYTGALNEFSKAVSFGTVASPGTTFSISGSQALWTGKNYFWLCYDVAPTATPCDLADMACTSITIGGAPYTVGAPWSPVGAQYIKGPMVGIYTIDKNAVTDCRTYNSYTDAINDLAYYGVGGAVTFNVASNSGPYTEHVSIPPISGASATNTITFQGNGEILQSSPTALDYSLVDINGADHVTLNNIYIKCNVLSSTTYGVLLRNQSDFVSVTNCTIDLSNSSGGAYVVTSSMVSGYSLGDNVNDCVISGNTMIATASRGPDYGLYLQGNPALQARPSQVHNNVIQDYYITGIYIRDFNGCIISGNDIARPTRTHSWAHIIGIHLIAHTTKSIIVDGNKIHNLRSANVFSAHPCYGIHHASGPEAGYTNTIRNNVIYNMDGSNRQFGIYLANARNTWVYHNTISLNNSVSTTFPTYGVYVTGSYAPGPDIKNNIISIGRAGSGDKYALYFDGTALGSSDYNDLYVYAEEGQKYTGAYNGINYLTLADWKAANNGAYDQHSKDGPPLFENEAAGNLKPQAAVVDNAGVMLSAVPKDILGNDRTGPDIGAWEFVLPSMPAMTVAGVTATQNTLSPVMIGSVGQLILRIEISTTGSSAPLNVTQFALGIASSTASGNYTGARIYYTGAINEFSRAVLFGTVASPGTTFSISGSQALWTGKNYFWLCYDVSASATPCDLADMECTSITVWRVALHWRSAMVPGRYPVY